MDDVLQLRATPMNLPDLPPWLDSVSDDDEELSCGETDFPYDE